MMCRRSNAIALVLLLGAFAAPATAQWSRGLVAHDCADDPDVDLCDEPTSWDAVGCADDPDSDLCDTPVSCYNDPETDLCDEPTSYDGVHCPDDAETDLCDEVDSFCPDDPDSDLCDEPYTTYTYTTETTTITTTPVTETKYLVGSQRITVDDPEEFVSDEDAKVAMQHAYADLSGANVSDVLVDIAVARRLQSEGAARRLAGEVIVTYQITVPTTNVASVVNALGQVTVESLKAAIVTALLEHAPHVDATAIVVTVVAAAPVGGSSPSITTTVNPWSVASAGGDGDTAGTTKKTKANAEAIAIALSVCAILVGGIAGLIYVSQKRRGLFKHQEDDNDKQDVPPVADQSQPSGAPGAFVVPIDSGPAAAAAGNTDGEQLEAV
jgi:hypothetical protein